VSRANIYADAKHHKPGWLESILASFIPAPPKKFSVLPVAVALKPMDIARQEGTGPALSPSPSIASQTSANSAKSPYTSRSGQPCQRTS